MTVQIIPGLDEKPTIIIEERAPEIVGFNQVQEEGLTWKDLLVLLSIIFLVGAVGAVGLWIGKKHYDAHEINAYQDTRTVDEKLDYIYKTLEEIKHE